MEQSKSGDKEKSHAFLKPGFSLISIVLCNLFCNLDYRLTFVCATFGADMMRNVVFATVLTDDKMLERQCIV